METRHDYSNRSSANGPRRVDPGIPQTSSQPTGPASLGVDVAGLRRHPDSDGVTRPRCLR
jgi:hypothetical protein